MQTTTNINASQFLSLLLKSTPKVDSYRVTQDVPNSRSDSSGFKIFHIKNCKFQNFDFGAHNFESLTLEGCELSSLSLNLSYPARKIILIGCTIGKLRIWSEPSQTIEKLEILNNKIDQVNIIAYSDEIRFNEGTYGSCSLTSVNSPVYINLYQIKVTTNFQIKGIGTNMDILESTIPDLDFMEYKGVDINIEKCKDSEIYFTLTNTDRLTFDDCNNCKVYFGGIVSKAVHFPRGNYSLVKFRGNGNFSITPFKAPEYEGGITRIDNLEFEDFILHKDHSINFNKVDFHTVIFNDSDNNGLIQIRNSTITKTFGLIASNLKKTKFNNVTIGKDCKVDIMDTDISEVIFDNFRWNNNYKLNEDYDSKLYDKKENFLIGLRESYRQLKSLFIKNGNKIEALEFQKHELRTHLKILAAKKTNSRRDFGNYLIVYTHKVFSDFGQSISRPLILLFTCHFLFFNSMLLSNDEVGTRLAFECVWDKQAVEHGIRLYFQTLLPTHFATVQSINNVDVFIGGFWDFIMRISAGYFIYYFISASRKYHQ